MVKRLFDLLIVVPSIVLLAPLFVLIAIWIKLDSRGPVLFRQKRVGRQGRLFEILKFRTMVTDAETQGPKITVAGDARITRSGRWLRRTKLDELPQLLNVAKGEMSLVGPRPEVPEYVQLYPEGIKDKILSVRPGITDLASIEYRNESDILARSSDPRRAYIEEVMPRKLDFYVQYVDQRSIWLDLKVIWQTFMALFR